ncbi:MULTISPECIES: helix-turn-helix domain-containing protein [Bacillus cereus group]|uniref:helix-turn-helix domain-containing protein n=1 Tax=Bacillus cereus group TaxID=86661 RepID=UPI0021D3E717|nr:MULTISPECIES: helix-turn-helix transcriptional regulator [Bacillus cereus group]MCU5568164.1 helix-turn-helix domain-containing protein [Bacillus paranthracis]MDA2760948.1 helix-turn-helix transcriptional regulator [Bacillus cereus group sp. Bc007]MDA2766610.1 helix-turn-helix transcriptional regulator [Bacillus cereus group sp. Bc008]MDA2777750.1 helix-turn-helix transcriptional regulator [Bacillus cereus group sp. Bc005]MDX5756526.1 helix-turn-helix transcriptional regulator [Bacillus cer
MHYGQVIKAKRQAQSLSSQKLADILGINRSALCLYETGKRNVSKNHAKIMENYINGRYDIAIRDMLLSNLRKKYEHLTGRKGLEFWE